ncbi:hypothetical protein CRUP_012173 [Coryphaenoides rupestris]|nr:hypothetical protein CRUP_012173 [Coryphaenoides rupestris]
MVVVEEKVMNLQMQLDNVTSFMDEHEENMHDLQYHARYYENRTGERFSTLDGRLNSIDMEIDTISSSINATVSHVQSMYKYINIESSSCQIRLGSHSEDLQYMLLSVRVDMDVRNLTMVTEELKLVDTHHTQRIKNFTILKGGRGGLGEKGVMGPKGDQGETGPPGGKGAPGMKGSKGSIGPPGANGDRGQKGDLGVPGHQQRIQQGKNNKDRGRKETSLQR